MSMIYSPINKVMLYGVALETVLFIVIVYVPGLNAALGARPVDIFNLGYLNILFIIYRMPGLPFSICLFCWEETRKYLIRNFRPSRKGVPNWFE